jgi:hypothetical protein
MSSSTKATLTAELRVDNKQQVAAMKQAKAANDAYLASIKKINVSSKLGGGGSRGSDAAIAYNFAQDFVQGGPMAVANNIPQVMGLVKRNMGLVAMASQAAAAAMAGVGIGWVAANPRDALHKLRGAIDVVTDWFNPDKLGEKVETLLASFDSSIKANDKWVEAQEKALAKRQSQNRLDEGTMRGKSAASNIDRVSEDATSWVAAVGDSAKRALTIHTAEEELERVKLEGIQDAEKRESALREFEKSTMEKRVAEMESSARLADRFAIVSAEKVQKELDSMERRAALEQKLVGPGGKSALLNELTPQLNALRQANAEAQKQLKTATQGVYDAKLQRGILPSRLAGLDQQGENARKEAALKRGKEAAESMSNAIIRGLEAAEKVAEAYEQARQKAADQAKQQGGLKDQLDIAEARSRRQNSKANRLQKAADLQSSVDKYTAAGFSPEEAAAMAHREQDAGSRRPGQISGAGRGGASQPRGSALDAFRNEPGLAERGIFIPRKRGDAKPPDATTGAPANAREIQKADPAVTALLEDIKSGINGLKGFLGGVNNNSSNSNN